MQTGLSSISKIFTERILRIPDYQRGYSWTEKHLKDFWTDLEQLEPDKNHYTGVLTLEDVPERTVESWNEDFWIINSKGYAPFYIVDGQQRLTTTIILIQVITEFVAAGDKLNYTSVEEIRKKFIYDSKDDGVSRSYIFGYEKDNPSYEFLKTRIFNEKSDNSFPIQETIYTHNLEFAKEYFRNRVASLDVGSVEALYRKLTQNFLFNVYSISSEVDVYVAFETMNNRGKPLSHLELLKNRLIYLSTRFATPEFEKERLRHAINEAWKSVYHYLGKNKQNPLDDDVFLGTHFVLYFGDELGKRGGFDHDAFRHYRRRMATSSGYKDYLLEVKFTPKNLTASDDGTSRDLLTTGEVYRYVKSLKESVEFWYALMNPADSSLSVDEVNWLTKLNRIGFLEVAPLILVFFQSERNVRLRVRVLQALERMLFIRTLIPVGPLEYHRIYLLDVAQQIKEKAIQSEKVIRDLEQATAEAFLTPQFSELVASATRADSFYGWRGLRYFLFEYEQYLRASSKTYRVKLDWDAFCHPLVIKGEDERDYHTVEHIYPQRPRKPCWIEKFKHYSDRERSALRHSLGNLVPLSKPKNSAFQNQCFIDKVAKPGSTVGFRYGSFSENEVANHSDWTGEEIFRRGLKMLTFMEQRWSISLGGVREKARILGLSFVPPREIGLRDVRDLLRKARRPDAG